MSCSGLASYRKNYVGRTKLVNLPNASKLMHPSRNDSIQIVAFAVPWPPNYGGAIDIFYKIKALHEQGVKTHLHAFAYDGHVPSDELESYCTFVAHQRLSFVNQ